MVNIKCTTANKQNLKVSHSITVKLKIQNFTWYIPLLVAEELGQNLILGADFIRKTALILDIYAKQYFFRFDRTKKYQFDSELSKEDVYKRQELIRRL